MTVPVDLGNNLFKKPYENGARVHLNSWGCKFTRTGDEDERAGQCNKYTTRARDVDNFVYEHPDFLVVFAAGATGLLDADGGIAEPGTCKNCLTVGSTHSWNKRYREAVLTRDPQVDICGACQHPYFCSRSDIIDGEVVAGDPIKREEALAALPKCCNDTLHEYIRFEDVEVPELEWFTFHFPNLTLYDPSLIAKVREYGWLRGAGIMYDFKASFSTIGTASATEDEAGIQVFLLFRQDFAEYFEDGTGATIDRDNPCITDYMKQGDESEQCMANNRGYERVDNCDPVSYESLTGQTLEWPDKHCHVGACVRLKPRESSADPKEKEEDQGKEWGKDPADGCPKDLDGKPTQTCCNDKFLSTMCINQQCTQISSRLSQHIRHRDITELNKKGFGIAVRNMNDRPIKLTGTVEIRGDKYPCTLSECCGDLDGNPETECCAYQYPRQFGAGEACRQCGAVPAPGKCHPFEVPNLPSWTTRGPGRSDYLENKGGKLVKPELVAPALQIVSANSDGFIPSVGEPEDLEAQCGLPSQYVMIDPNRCLARSAARFLNATAVRAETGSSIAAALVAGSAAVIRQYFADGYYPLGIKNQSNTMHANPSAALVKAMLINSARSVGGTVDTYTYNVGLPNPVLL